MKKTWSCLVVIIISLAGCAVGVQPVNYGKENCELCKMTIMNNQFAAELITKKGKVFKFDDIHCMALYIKNVPVDKENINQLFITDFSMPGKFINAGNAVFIKSENLRSPMEGNIAAFENADSAKKYLMQFDAADIKLSSIIP